jgi:ATP-dependent Lon protease
MFICTANSLHSIPQPLLDRMELIRLSGYTELEKLNIAKKYLLPKQITDNGLQEKNMIVDDSAIIEVVRRYTRESGVRNLERDIATLARKAAVEVVDKGSEHRVVISSENITKYLGQPKFRFGKGEEDHQVGTTTGLAWTEKGGELLVIETSVLPGRGRLQITGKLGDVMQESARAAISYVRSRAEMLGLPKYFYDKVDIHVHVPEGAIPKDGPSAGITMATSIVSALTGIPVDKQIAMTGEITLRGNVLPIGGLKEKSMAAHRGGIRRICIPKDNENDIEEIPATVRNELEFIPVTHVDQVLFEALVYDDAKDFDRAIERRHQRDELLFSEDKKSSEDEDGKEKGNSAVVTH